MASHADAIQIAKLTASDLAGSFSYYEPRLESEIERVQEVIPTVAMTIARDLSLISDEGLPAKSSTRTRKLSYAHELSDGSY